MSLAPASLPSMSTSITKEASAVSSDLGRVGEDATVDWYRDHGYALVARNWRCPLGELDLVVARGALLVFCEVKTRAGSSFGAGFEAVTSRKQRKLRQLAEVFLLATG